MQPIYNFIGNVVHLIINPLIALIMAAAVAYFLWGAAQMVMNASNAEARQKGQRQLVWGIIGFFLMVSVFGILNVVLSTFCTPQTDGSGAIFCPGE